MDKVQNTALADGMDKLFKGKSADTTINATRANSATSNSTVCKDDA